MTTQSGNYAYGPALGLPDTKVGTFTQALYNEATKQGRVVISMKNDWRRVFVFENDSLNSYVAVACNERRLWGRLQPWPMGTKCQILTTSRPSSRCLRC